MGKLGIKDTIPKGQTNGLFRLSGLILSHNLAYLVNGTLFYVSREIKLVSYTRNYLVEYIDVKASR